MQRIFSYITVIALILQVFGVPPQALTQPDVAHAAVRVNYLGVAGKFKVGANPPNLRTGLVGHWTFDSVNMGPNVRDVSGQGNHGQLSGFTSTTTVAGKVGQGLRFDGSNDQMLLPNMTGSFTTQGSFSVWVKLTYHTPAGATQTGSWHIGNAALQSHYPYTDGIIYESAFTDTRKTVGSGLISDRTQWHLVTITADSGSNEWKFYQNGQLYLTSTVGTFTFPSAPTIGRSLADWTIGSLDDARLYNRVLSASEITQIYRLGSHIRTNTTVTPPNLQTGLIGHWTFDGKHLNPNMRDASGQGNHGTLAGFTSTTTVPGKLGQALQFNGTSNAASAAVNLSSYTTVSISFWLNWDSFANDDKLAFEYVNNSNNQNGILINPNSGAPCTGSFSMFSMGSGSSYRGGCFPRPSARVWHHYVMVFDRATPSNAVYVDGVLQTLTPQNNGGLPTNFANSSLYFMSRGTSSLFGAGKLDDVRLYNRVLTAAEAVQLYNLGR